MSNNDLAKREYDELRKTIDYHMDRYYNQDNPEISDYDYDRLMLRLKAIEKEHPEYVDENSPTRKIGGVAKREAGVKVTHDVPMLSIEDVFTKEAVIEWVEKVKLRHPDCTFSVETKIDGLSMTLRYQKNEEGVFLLKLAETRGDGIIGEDVTANALVIDDVKKTLEIVDDENELELRGEVYMSHDDFYAYNELQEKNGLKTAANPRNLAAGTLRQLDPQVTKERGLMMFIFNVQKGSKRFMESHTKGLDELKKAGVPIVHSFHCKNADEIIEAIDKIGNMRENLTYDIDGAVVKIDEIAYREDFPQGSKYQSGHIAYKYPPEERVVTMDDIEVDVGRTGKLTFTGVFHDSETGKPARLCGTSVSRATLHNKDYIADMKIGIGGEYKLFKSGEIIPKLNGCVKEPEKVFVPPTICPICGEKLIIDEDTTDIRCVNPFCKAQLIRTLSYFTSLDCMNIAGLGATIVEKLIDDGFLNSFTDIYRLKERREELIEKGIIGREKNTDKILEAIEASKNNEPERLLSGFGIRNVGKRTAYDLMKHFESIEELMDASLNKLTSIDDIGELTALCIRDFFDKEENKKMVHMLSELGVNLKKEETETSTILEGLTIVVTGTLKSLSRNEITELITKNGGKCAGSVSKKTSFLVAGEDAGSKLTKANDLGVKVISEEEFLELLSKKE